MYGSRLVRSETRDFGTGEGRQVFKVTKQSTDQPEPQAKISHRKALRRQWNNCVYFAELEKQLKTLCVIETYCRPHNRPLASAMEAENLDV